MRLRCLLAAALLAGTTGVLPAEAASPPAVARGALGAETTITWSGVAAIRLSVPRETEFVDGAFDLWVTGANYAFVRILEPYRPGCPRHMGPRCSAYRLSWMRGFHDDGTFDALPPSRRHSAAVLHPPIVATPHVDLYLFTDGRATLRLRTTGLRGRTAYRPAARVRGHASMIAPTCVPLGCADATGRTNGYTYGGETFDLQGDGWAEFYVLNRSDGHGGSAVTGSNQPRSIAGCLFPNWREPYASADPADHPYGCSDTSGHRAADALGEAARMHASGTNAGSLAGINSPWSGAKGKQYIGFQGFGAGPSASRAVGYGIWFRFLP